MAISKTTYDLSIFLLLLLTISSSPFLISATNSSTTTYNVLSFGAKPDGLTDSTEGFLSAWAAACASESVAVICVPRGRFLLRSLAFKGECRSPKIGFKIDGTLVAPADYRVLRENDKWISFEGVSHVSVVGGRLDARGAALWACKLAAAGGANCPGGATTLSFTNSKDIKIIGLMSLNSQMFHIVINACSNVQIQGVKVIADGNSPNTDGIHVQLSTNVVIKGSTVKTGDDCISVGPGTKNLWIEHVACGPGHGISIGSLGGELVEAGVQNVTVKNASFTGTQNGLRIKAWAKPSSGFVKGVQFEDVTMRNVQNPIIIDQNYCPHNIDCPSQVSGIKISDVVYQGIRGTSATPVAIKFDCSAANPCTGIKLQDVNLNCLNQAAESSCTNVNGKAFGIVQPNGCL
ncbi:hypothetical protein TIFTF001_012920 [Ficus carica]|uniref:Polygalacturonase n=1 Tax=Ficus carica TaxID=3494 RepID=A0AA87ZWS6_FICCA|nr:hypothetical protein TIFTF001_012920 [Ficus carica]